MCISHQNRVHSFLCWLLVRPGVFKQWKMPVTQCVTALSATESTALRQNQWQNSTGITIHVAVNNYLIRNLSACTCAIEKLCPQLAS